MNGILKKKFAVSSNILKMFIKLVCLLIPISFVLNFNLYGQLSPGDLSSVHADLEGLINCTQCHGAGEKISSSKCLSCHVILRERINSNVGLHSKPEYSKCQTCHVEHQGRDFKLIFWKEGQSNFDHQDAGFVLEGKHTELECNSCHRVEFIQDKKTFKEKNKNLEKTFLGLNKDCLSCHRDEHRGQMNKNCLNCHVMEGWKPASKFGHNQTKFSLIGQHQQVNCSKCHKSVTDNKFPDDHSFSQYNLTNFRQCSACHQDAHTGKLGPLCNDCHSPVGWNKINQANFNHDLTNFPLRGRHLAVRCEQCHHSGQTRGQLKFANCTDCHSDFHKGAFANRPSGGECSECHHVYGFSPSTFTIQEHQYADFKLDGAHLAIPCIACHKQKGNRSPGGTYKFQFISFDCQTCHSDPHKGQLKKYIDVGGCNFCHNTQTWRTVQFNHSQTGFALTGKHQLIDCKSCHVPKNSSMKTEHLRFEGLSKICQECHTDKHEGQFNTLVTVAGNTRMISDCSRCHTSENWLPNKFDHEKDATFKLEGAHKTVSCYKCHLAETKNGIKFVRFKPIESKCRSCHGEEKEFKRNLDENSN
jgi:hypothetical protein